MNNKCGDILCRNFISHQEFGEIQLDEIQLLAKYNASINNNLVRYFYLTLKNKIKINKIKIRYKKTFFLNTEK